MSNGADDENGARRVDAARHLADRRQLRDSLTLAPQPSLRNSALAGLQAALTMAIAMPIMLLSPWADLIGFAALGALVALFGRFAPQRDRGRIVLQCAFWQVLAVFGMSLLAHAGAPVAVQLGVLAALCGAFHFIVATGGYGAPGPLIFVFAAGAALAPELPLSAVIGRTAATLAVALLAVVVCALTERFRQLPTAESPLPAEPRRPLSARLMAAARTALGAAVAIFASYGFGAEYPAWAAMGAMAVLQGTRLHLSMNRALQRMAGTVVGAVFCWFLLIQDPSPWAVIAVLIALQFLTEVVIGINYGLGQILITPMALLMTHLAAPTAAGARIVPERILDTILGASVGILIALVFSTLDDRRHLAELRRGDPR